jgi:hypothetical protein
VLHDEEEVGEYLLLSESEGNSSDSELDTDNELDDHAILDVMVNDGSDEDDSITQDIVWESVQNHKGQRENFMGIVGPQGSAKHMTEIVDFFYCFSVEN